MEHQWYALVCVIFLYPLDNLRWDGRERRRGSHATRSRDSDSAHPAVGPLNVPGWLLGKTGALSSSSINVTIREQRSLRIQPGCSPSPSHLRRAYPTVADIPKIKLNTGALMPAVGAHFRNVSIGSHG